MQLMLDPKPMLTKPAKSEIGQIVYRMADNPVEISLEELTEKILAGHSFSPAYFEGAAKTNLNWRSQELFGLDFDSGITIEEFMDICDKYHIKPAIVYTTYSHTEESHRFRAIWLVPSPVMDRRLRWLILQSLVTMFDMKSDKQCYDEARFFFGGKDLIHWDHQAFVDPIMLIQAVVAMFDDKNDGHTSRNIEELCRRCHISRINGSPAVFLGEVPIQELAANGMFIIRYYNKQLLSRQKVQTFIFQCSEADFSPIKTDKSGRQSLVKSMESFNDIVEFPKIQVNPFNLSKSCLLAASFIDGERWLYHPELFHLMTWFINIEGGTGYFLKTLANYDFYGSKQKEFRHYAKYAASHGYHPQQCSDICPHFSQCANKHLKLGERFAVKRRQIRQVEQPTLKTLNEAETEFNQAFQRAMTATDNRIYIIKAPTGLGKTEQYLNLKNALIAVPTHQLREEVVARMTKAGNPVATVPEIPSISPEVDCNLFCYYQAGAYSEAAKYLKNLIKTSNGCNPNLQEYADQLTNFSNIAGSAVITHEKALFLNQIKQQTLIFDEDPFENLIKINCTSINDIATLIETSEGLPIQRVFQALLDVVNSAVINQIVTPPKFDVDRRFLSQIAAKVRLDLASDVLGLLDAIVFIKTNVHTISYVVRRDLPKNRKIIILSATANKKLYEQLYGDRVDFVDIGQVETAGTLIQHTDYSYSRQCLENHPELFAVIRQRFPKAALVTFKKYAKEVVADLHFGAVEGINYLTGQDLVIVGTPHVNSTVYTLIAYGLGIQLSIWDYTKFKYAPVQRNGYEFWFTTYSSGNILQEIQLHLVESELYQSIGRARILREKCTVHLFSNYPIPGAILSEEPKKRACS
jgi:hypothetical protein